MGCFKCGYSDYKRAFTHTKESFIGKSEIIRNFKYDYSLIHFVNLESQLSIICPNHGAFNQKAKYHFLRGCRKCSEDNRYGSGEEKTKEFIKKANSIHNSKYDYSNTKIINSKDDIIISCSVHGDFKQSPSNHLKGQGCSECGKTIRGEIEKKKQRI